MTDSVRIAFIGAGTMGQLAHLENYVGLRADGLCEIVGITDLRPGLAAAVAERHRLPRIYSDADELLGDEGVQGVCCIQQWPNNYPLVRRALEAGKSVITEKPMTGRIDEARALADLAADRGLLYAVGFMKRYDPGIELARRLCQRLRSSGELGALLSVDAHCDQGNWRQNAGLPIQVGGAPVPPVAPRYPDACTTAGRQAAYEHLIHVFSHHVNLVHHLLDSELEPRHAAFGARHAFSATLRQGEVLVTIRGAESASPEWREWTTLTFEHGQMRIKSPTPMNRQQVARVFLLKRTLGGFTTTRHEAPIEWSFRRQARGFCRALQGREELRSPGSQCLADVRVMERLIEVAELADDAHAAEERP